MKTSFPFIARARTPLRAAFGSSAAAISQRCSELVAIRRRSAFSLIEIMVTVGLLSFIILGLLAMFTQTQKAFKGSMTQTDVLEAGRSVMEMLSREIEQGMPTGYPEIYYGNQQLLATNCFIEMVTSLRDPLIQDLPGSASPPSKRVNYLQRFFFLSKVNQDWIGTGYQVVTNEGSVWVGALYRYSVTNFPRNGPFTASGSFSWNTPITNMARIAEGIVHFRVRPFAPNGFPLLSDGNALGPAFYRTNGVIGVSGAFPYGFARDIIIRGEPRAPDKALGYYFFGRAVPAFVELELGILEPQVYQRFKSIPEQVPAARRQFLSDHVGQVHIFRQRIPIRNVDVSVYP